MGCVGSTLAPGLVLLPATDLACKTDKDCLIEGSTDGDCCGALCEYSELMTTERQEARRVWRGSHCPKKVTCAETDWAARPMTTQRLGRKLRSADNSQEGTALIPGPAGARSPTQQPGVNQAQNRLSNGES